MKKALVIKVAVSGLCILTGFQFAWMHRPQEFFWSFMAALAVWVVPALARDVKTWWRS